MDFEREIFLDNILKRFSGDVPIYKAVLRKEYESDMATYYHIENELKYLEGEGIIEFVGSKLYKLKPKGWAMLANMDTMGFVAKEKERLAIIVKENSRFWFVAVVTFLTLIISIPTYYISCKQILKENQAKERLLPPQPTLKQDSTNAKKDTQNHK